MPERRSPALGDPAAVEAAPLPVGAPDNGARGGAPRSGEVLVFDVEGMTCGSCAARVERTLRRQGGVVAAGVNFATGRATVELDPEAPATQPDLVASIDRVGYHLTPLAAPGAGEEG